MSAAHSAVPEAVYIAWWTGLIVVILLVPVAIVLLQRTLNAALSIRRYLAEMEAAGASIAGNTSAISALNDTLVVADGMLATAGNLDQHSGTLASTLAQRAGVNVELGGAA